MWDLKVEALAVLIVIYPGANAQKSKPFVLLPSTAAHGISRFCSREGVSNITGSWHPNKNDIQRLESRLPLISSLRSAGELNGVQIQHPDRYYRQYIAVVVGSHKMIYVNAFSDDPLPPWRTGLVDVCDSGPSGWGVLYDPITGKFSSMRVNSTLAVPPPPPERQ